MKMVSTFSPNDLKVLDRAFQRACLEAGRSADREAIAVRIMEAAQRGGLEAAELEQVSNGKVVLFLKA